MSLNDYCDEVQRFMLGLEKDKVFSSSIIITLIEQEFATLKININNKVIVDHQLYDLLFLLLELAVYNKTDLDSEWLLGKEKKKKYLVKKI